MAHLQRRAPPGGYDTVSALLQNSTPAGQGHLSKALAKEQYAAELRAQMAEQLGNKQDELMMYHSRPAGQRRRGPSPDGFIPAEPERFIPAAQAERLRNGAEQDRFAITGMPREGLLHPIPPHPAAGPPLAMPDHTEPTQQPFHHVSPGQAQVQPLEYPSLFIPPGQQYSPPMHEHGQQPAHQHLHQPMHMQHQAIPAMPDYHMPPDYSPPHMPPPHMPRGQLNQHSPGFHMPDQQLPQHPNHYPEHQRIADLWAQQRGPPPASQAGILGFLRTESKQEGRKAEKAAAYRAELQAQMQQTQEARRKLKEEERAQDKKMLDALLANPPNRHLHGRGSPPPLPGPPIPNAGTSVYMGDRGGPAAMTAHPPAMAALEGAGGAARGVFRDTVEGQHNLHYGLQENDCAAGNRQHSYTHQNYATDGGRAMGHPSGMQQSGSPVGPAAPSTSAIAAAHGGIVPRGVLVNAESSLADTPTLHFKSDKAFLTAAELASRTAAATDLQASLQAQIAEKKARKDAEDRAEREREAAEMRRLQREQEELARKQQEDLEHERKSAEKDLAAQDQVAEAWRKAQQEAAPRRGRLSGRHGSSPHGASTGGGGGGGGAPSHAAVAGLREGRSRSRSPGRDGGARVHSGADRGPAGHARVGFMDPHTPDDDHAFERGPSWAHGGQQRPPDSGPRPLSSRHPVAGHAGLGNDSVTQKLEQIRAEMYSDNDRLRSQLAARNADVSSLLDRAAEYERQSRAAQDELESIRLHMHAAANTQSELDTLPDPPMRFDHVPGYSPARPHHSELNADTEFMAARMQNPTGPVHATVEQGFLPQLHGRHKTQDKLCRSSGEIPNQGGKHPVGAAATAAAAAQPAQGEGRRARGAAAAEPAHHTLHSGFLGDLPPPAARQRALAVDTAAPCRRTAPSAEQEEPLVAHTEFIPLPGARPPQAHRDAHSSHHHSTARSLIMSAAGELRTTSATVGAPWLSPPHNPHNTGKLQPSQLPRFERVKIPAKQSEARPGLDAARLAADPQVPGLTNPPIFIDLAQGGALDEGDVLPADSAFLDEGGLNMMNNDRLAMLNGLQLQGDVKSSVEVLDAFLDGFVNQGNASVPLYSSTTTFSRAALDAGGQASRQHFASRPSETSVQGMTLQQVHQTSAAALHTMAEAEEILGAVSAPQLPMEARDGGSRGLTPRLHANSARNASARYRSVSQEPPHSRGHEAPEANFGSGVEARAVEDEGAGLAHAPEVYQQAKSRYTAVSDDEDYDDESARASDRDPEEQQGMEQMHVAGSGRGHVVGVSAETLESVELEASEDGSSDLGAASDEESSPVAGRQ